MLSTSRPELAAPALRQVPARWTPPAPATAWSKVPPRRPQAAAPSAMPAMSSKRSPDRRWRSIARFVLTLYLPYKLLKSGVFSHPVGHRDDDEDHNQAQRDQGRGPERGRSRRGQDVMQL